MIDNIDYNSLYSKADKDKFAVKDTYTKALETVIARQIPERYPEEFSNLFMFGALEMRDKFISNIGFTLVSWSWIRPLAKWIGNRKVLEVMSGTGSLSYALSECGVDIKATDNFSWNSANTWNKEGHYFCDIENIDCIDAIKKYGKDIDILVISWAYMDDFAYKCLMTLREVNSEAIILFIGEGCGGCTADDDFFAKAEEIECQEIHEINNEFQSWGGIHDRIYIYINK